MSFHFSWLYLPWRDGSVNVLVDEDVLHDLDRQPGDVEEGMKLDSGLLMVVQMDASVGRSMMTTCGSKGSECPTTVAAHWFSS